MTEKVYTDNVENYKDYNLQEGLVKYYSKLMKLLNIYVKGFQNKRLLDIGCGEGFIIKRILEDKENIPDYILGIDFSSGMIDYCLSNIAIENKVEFNLNNALVPISYSEEKFDFVYSNFNILVCCNNYENLLNYCENFFVNMKEGGKGLIITSRFEDSSLITDDKIKEEKLNALIEGMSYDHPFGPINNFDTYKVKLYSDYKNNKYVEVLDYAIYENCVLKALKEVGFKNVTTLNLLDFGFEKIFAELQSFYSFEK